MRDSIELIDAQVHVWERDHPGQPWVSTPPLPTLERAPFFDGSSTVPDEDMIRMMDEVGVNAAILVTSTRHYGIDNSYALAAAARHPDRFRVVGRIDPYASDVEDRVAAWRELPIALGLRLLTLSDRERAHLREGQFDRTFAAAERDEVPMCVYPARALTDLARVAERFTGLQLVVDHLGLIQRPLTDMDDDPFARLPELLSLARYPNVAVKLTAVPALSYSPFPYLDVWPHVHKVIDAFGPERVMWGTDCTRMLGITSYDESVRWITEANELSKDDLTLILGQTARRIFRWN